MFLGTISEQKCIGGLYSFLCLPFSSPSQKLLTSQNVNCRDTDGRNSTPLHFAAGYNRVEIVEYLLLNGANVHAKDKGYGTGTGLCHTS